MICIGISNCFLQEGVNSYSTFTLSKYNHILTTVLIQYDEITNLMCHIDELCLFIRNTLALM